MCDTSSRIRPTQPVYAILKEFWWLAQVLANHPMILTEVVPADTSSTLVGVHFVLLVDSRLDPLLWWAPFPGPFPRPLSNPILSGDWCCLTTPRAQSQTASWSWQAVWASWTPWPSISISGKRPCTTHPIMLQRCGDNRKEPSHHWVQPRACYESRHCINTVYSTYHYMTTFLVEPTSCPTTAADFGT
jgi:hypothetical protein